MDKRSGLTLVEVLIAAVLVSFLGGVIYSTFLQGVRVWSRVQKNSPDVDVELFLEKFTEDLRNAFMYAQEEFTGGADSLRFFSKAFTDESSLETGSGERRAPVQVEYTYDPKVKAIRRREHSFQSVLSKSQDWGKDRLAVEKVLGIKLEYYYRDTLRNEFSWRNQWQGACLPDSVKVSLDYGDRLNPQKVYKLITIPSGGQCA